MGDISIETIAFGIGIITLLVLLFLVVFTVVLFFQLRKLQGIKSDPSEIAPQIAVLGEKLSRSHLKNSFVGR